MKHFSRRRCDSGGNTDVWRDLCIFQVQWLISSDVVQKQMISNSLLSHYLNFMTRIRHQNMFYISLQTGIDIDVLQIHMIRVTVSIKYWNTDYTGLKQNNINTFE